MTRLARRCVSKQAVAFVAADFFATTSYAGIEEGKQKAQVCIACHGADGNATLPGTPSIAGQPRQFLVQALFMFREGKRSNAVMAPFADKLSNTDMNDLASFFASQKMVEPTHKTTPERIAQGKAVVEKNNCNACHGATLLGQQHIPRLASQRADYLKDQLKQFRASTRGDMDGTMTSAVQGLTPEDIELLTDYLGSLAAPQ